MTTSAPVFRSAGAVRRRRGEAGQVAGPAALAPFEGAATDRTRRIAASRNAVHFEILIAAT
jgi:hypothetical protein